MGDRVQRLGLRLRPLYECLTLHRLGAEMILSKLTAIAAAALLSSATFIDTASAAVASTPQDASAQQRDAERLRARDTQQAQSQQRQELRDRAANGRGRRERQPSVEEVAASAQAAAAAANLSCQVSEAALLGKTAEKDDLYEVACQGGGGYLLQSSSPPQAFDCLLLAASAEQAKARGEEVAEGSVCSLPANQNGLGVISAYAREAGVLCQIDAGKVVGTTAEGNLVYEVGCPGTDGYRIEKNAQGWNKTDCLQVIASNATCEFTTTEEQVAGFKTMLPGTDIDDCDAQQIRLMGQNDNGRFIEVKCASGDGFVTRVKDNAIAQVYACAVAQRVGGGCTMTPVAAATTEQQ